MMNKIILIAGVIMALSGSAFANEDAANQAQQQCTQSADEAGLQGEDRANFIAGCTADSQQGKNAAE